MVTILASDFQPKSKPPPYILTTPQTRASSSHTSSFAIIQAASTLSQPGHQSTKTMMSARQTPLPSYPRTSDSIPLAPLYPPPTYTPFTSIESRSECLPPYLPASSPPSYRIEINDTPRTGIYPEQLAKKRHRRTLIEGIIILLLTIAAVVVVMVLDPILKRCAVWVEPLVTVGILFGFFAVGVLFCSLVRLEMA
jgi:hypothetical protein